MESSFLNLPPKIPLSRKGDFSLLKNRELTYSSRSLRSVKFTLIILVVLMIVVAAGSTAFMISSGDIRETNTQAITQMICLWVFPMIIYSYFSWLHLTRSRYRVSVSEEGITYQRIRSTEFIPHSEIMAALGSKPVLRNRVGVWLPTRRKLRILLSEVDTLPGRPFIEDILAFYDVPMPRDPYGTDRNTFSALGMSLLFVVAPMFVWSGYLNANIRALNHSLYIAGFVILAGVILLMMSNHTTRAFRNDPEMEEDDDFIYEDEFPDPEDDGDGEQEIPPGQTGRDDISGNGNGNGNRNGAGS